MSPSGRSRQPSSRKPEPPEAGVVVNGWTMLAHPLFLDAVERLAGAARKEREKKPRGSHGPNTKLLAHIFDLAFEVIPRNPGAPHLRHGGSLGSGNRHWFRAKTGGGRYRLFYRFHSSAKIIVLAWVNDEETLRTYGGKSDAYRVFADILESGNPPGDWDALLAAVRDPGLAARLRKLFATTMPPG